MKGKILILALLISLAFPSMAYAKINLSLDIAEKFSLGQEIKLNFSIQSDKPLEITYMTGIICSGESPISVSPIQKTIDLEKGLSETYSFFKVGPEMPSAICEAYLAVKEPQYLEIGKNFSIDGNPIADFTIDLCADESCSLVSNSFKQNEKIYLSIRSGNQDISGYEAMAVISGPEDRILELSNLKADFSLSKTGEYALNITLGGDMSSRSKLKFFFIRDSEESSISKKPNAENACKIDGVCEGKETSANCPLDCAEKTYAGPDPLTVSVLIVLAIAILLISGVILTKQKKQRKKG